MKILVVDLSYMGDVLMGSPVVKAFSPSDQIDLWTLSESKQIAKLNPFWNAIHTKYGFWKFRKYDLIINLHTSLKTNLLIWLTGVKSVGYNYKNRGLLHSIKVPIRTRTLRSGNRTDEVCHLVFKGLNRSITDRQYILDIPSDAKHFAEALLDGKFAVVFHVNCKNNHRERRWAAEKFAEIADLVANHSESTYILFTGAASDRDYISDLLKKIKHPERAIAITGIPLSHSAAVAQRALALVTINTSMLHIGVATGVPTIAVIGRTPKNIIVPVWARNVTVYEDPALIEYDPHSAKELIPRHGYVAAKDVFDKLKEFL